MFILLVENSVPKKELYRYADGDICIFDKDCPNLKETIDEFKSYGRKVIKIYVPSFIRPLYIKYFGKPENYVNTY